MKRAITAIILVFLSNAVFSQLVVRSVYIEGGGPALLSANFDLRFSAKENGLGGRFGIGGFGVAPLWYWNMPLELNYILGKNFKHKFEVGAGVTLSSDLGIIVEPDPNSPYSPPSAYERFSESFTTTHGHLSFAYRYQPKIQGLYFRAALTPIISQKIIPFFGGLSIGYRFKYVE